RPADPIGTRAMLTVMSGSTQPTRERRAGEECAMTTARRGASPAATGARRGVKLSRKEQGERTRRAILDAAVELYADTGYRGTGLMAIGRRAGVHHATVLYHFGSARDLLIAALRERDRRLSEFARGPRREGGLAALRSLPLVAEFNRDNALW